MPKKGSSSAETFILSALDHLQDAFVIVNTNWEYIFANKKAASLLGKSQKEMIGKGVWEISPSVKKLPIYVTAQTAMKQRKHMSVPYYSPNMKKWLFIDYYPFRGGLVAVYRDISEKKQYEKILHQQSQLLDITKDAMIVLNEKNEILYWNKGAELLYGWNKKEAIGTIANTLLHTEFPQNRERIIDALKRKGTWKGTLSHTAKDGKRILVDSQWSIVPQSDEFTILEVNRDITSAYETEKNLHETKNQLEAILENAIDGILVQDTAGKILFANKPLLNMFGGFTLEEIQKKKLLFYKDVFDFYDEDAQLLSPSRFPGARVLAGEKKVSQVLHAVHKDTKVATWIHVSSTSVVDKHTEKPALIVSVVHDITSRKQTEESLRFLSTAGEILSSSLDYETTLQRIAELSVPTIADWCSVEMLDGEHVYMMAVAHADPKKVAWAKQVRQYMKINMTATSGLPNVLKTGKPEFYPRVTDDMLVAAARSQKQLSLLRNIGFSSLIIVPLKADHKIIGAIQLVSTESKRQFTTVDLDLAIHLADKASAAIENSLLYKNLQQEQQRVTDIIANIPGVVWEAYSVWDKKRKHYTLRPTFVSQYAEILFGYPVEDWLEDTIFWKKIIHPKDYDRVVHDLDVLYASKKEGVIQCQCITKDGQTIWVEWQCNPIIGKSENPIGLRGVAMDISQQKKLEQRKDDFVSMASHELKTPLTSTKVFAQILQRRFEKSQDQESKKFIVRMNEQIDKLSDLVKDLLDVTRIQQQKLHIKKEKFLVKELVEELVENIQPSTDHTLEVSIDEKEYMEADKEKIRQVLTNFITNAIKYSPSDKKIIITAKRKKREITVFVKDFGVGIPKSQQHKVFDRFYQASHTDASRNTYPGLGLGLYISAEIVRLHKGKIGVKSTFGKGATFYFSLPV